MNLLSTTIGFIANIVSVYLEEKMKKFLLALTIIFLGLWGHSLLPNREVEKISRTLDSLQTQLKECKTLIALADGQLCKTSYYGDKHQGKRTASGAVFDKNLPMCASWDYPLGTVLQVTNLVNGNTTYGMVLDKGPDVPSDPLRKLDVSESMAADLKMLGAGVVPVLVKKCNAKLYGYINVNEIYYKKVRKAVSESWYPKQTLTAK